MQNPPINEGHFVRHIARPQWGLGFVHEILRKSVHVVFENEGSKMIGHDFVERLLAYVPPDEVPEDSKVATIKGRKELLEPKAPARPAARRARPLAIFTRHQTSHIEEALAIQTETPDREVTFRAAARWVSPHKAVAGGMAPPVYIALADGGATVSHEAQLTRVLVDPEDNQDKAIEIGGFSLESTREEPLWGKQVQTLYTITNLRKLEEPFPMTKLIRFNGGKSIDANYNRAYCLVRPVSDEPEAEAEA